MFHFEFDRITHLYLRSETPNLHVKNFECRTNPREPTDTQPGVPPKNLGNSLTVGFLVWIVFMLKGPTLYVSRTPMEDPPC